MVTTTLTTKATYTGVSCKSSIINCPASLQVTSQQTVTKTHITVVPSGVDPTFPESTYSGVNSTITFGSSASRFAAISGSPTSYVPGTNPSDRSNDHPGNGTFQGVFGGKRVRGSNKLIIGVSVGVGIPVLAALIAGL
jgi:hypothetical protein